MGISVSSTQTHERLMQKRAGRRMKAYQQKSPTTLKDDTFENNKINETYKLVTSEQKELHQISNVRNLQINLKMQNVNKPPQIQNLSSPKGKTLENHQSLDRVKQTQAPQYNQPLTIKHNKTSDNNVSAQSSLQQIDLTPNNQLIQQIRVNANNQPDITSFNALPSNKQIGSVSQRNISIPNQTPSKSQENEEAQREQEMKRRKIEQTKKYIQEASYPKIHAGKSSFQSKPHNKIESILSGENSEKIKMQQKGSIRGVEKIKLKTEEEFIDEIKRNEKIGYYKEGGSNRKESKGGAASLNLLNKKT